MSAPSQNRRFDFVCPLRAAFSGLAVASALAFAGCSDPPHAPPPPPPPSVVVATVATQDVPVEGAWVGTTKGYVNAQIRPQVEGYLLSQAYKEGSTVRKGDVLFEIDPREFEAQLSNAKGQVAEAQAALGKSELDVKRYTPLAREGAISQQELDDAIQARLADLARVEQARADVEQAELNLGWTKVVSPIDGIAGIAVGQIGDLVDTATVLTTVSTLDPIKVSFSISEQEYLRLARARLKHGETGDQKDFSGALTLTLADGSVYPHAGTLIIVQREVEVSTGAIGIEGAFPNPDNLLRPGQYAKITAVINTEKDAMTVPQKAVIDEQGSKQVAVVGTDDKVAIKAVTMGPKWKEVWVVEKGLKPGDRIVIEGTQKVRDGTVVKPTTASAPSSDASPH